MEHSSWFLFVFPFRCSQSFKRALLKPLIYPQSLEDSESPVSLCYMRSVGHREREKAGGNTGRFVHHQRVDGSLFLSTCYLNVAHCAQCLGNRNKDPVDAKPSQSHSTHLCSWCKQDKHVSSWATHRAVTADTLSQLGAAVSTEITVLQVQLLCHILVSFFYQQFTCALVTLLPVLFCRACLHADSATLYFLYLLFIRS